MSQKPSRSWASNYDVAGLPTAPGDLWYALAYRRVLIDMRCCAARCTDIRMVWDKLTEGILETLVFYLARRTRTPASAFSPRWCTPCSCRHRLFRQRG